MEVSYAKIYLLLGLVVQLVSMSPGHGPDLVGTGSRPDRTAHFDGSGLLEDLFTTWFGSSVG